MTTRIVVKTLIVVEYCEERSCGECGTDHPAWRTVYRADSWAKVFEFLYGAWHLFTLEKYKRMSVKHTRDGALIYLWFMP